jgi:hypothetical protein
LLADSRGKRKERQKVRESIEGPLRRWKGKGKRGGKREKKVIVGSI